MNEYRKVYVCRLCGARNIGETGHFVKPGNHEKPYVGSIPELLNGQEIEPFRNYYHECSNGDVGIMEFQGFVREKRLYQREIVDEG